ncbi:MAG: EamA family transporter [Deltaproteobacteria bacterium]|nr:EamA family transporter [Deltaproteobacteria bacterium]
MAPNHPAPNRDPAAARRAALTLVVSSTLFAIMAAGTKLATRRLPGGEVALFRFAIGIVVTGIFVWAGRAQIRPSRWGWLVARGLFGGIAVVTYFLSIQAVPVGVATLLNQTQPIYTMLFSWMLLGERPGRAAWGALVLALAGVTVIVFMGNPGAGQNAGFTLRGSQGEFLGVFSALASGVAVTSVRAARRDRGDGTPFETAWSVFFSFSLIGALVSLPTVFGPFGRFVAPTPGEWALLAGVGLVSTAAQLIMSASFRHLTGAQGGIIAQLTVPITVALGFLLLDETVTGGFLLGAALTLAGVLVAILKAAPRGIYSSP